MIQAKIEAWIAKQTLQFWLRLLGAVLILSILITPTCMYFNIKGDLRDAKATIQGYEIAVKAQKKAEKEVVTKIEYKDRIVEKKVTQTKIKREYTYVKDEEARSWGCTAIPDSVIGVYQDGSGEGLGPETSRARALPDYCK